MTRQSSDPFVAAREAAGYRSRASFKLLQLDARFKLLRPGARVLDLGCSPGGWAQVAAGKVGESGTVVGVDLLPMDPIPGVKFIQGSLLESETLHRLVSPPPMGDAPRLFDLILSDMAPEFSGNPSIDVPRSQDLARKALSLALYPLLSPGGSLILKFFQGAGDKELMQDFGFHFKTVRHEKPKASRSGSREGFLVCLKFAPRP